MKQLYIMSIRKLFSLFLGLVVSLTILANPDTNNQNFYHIDKNLEAQEQLSEWCAGATLSKETLHLFSHGKSGELLLDKEWKTAQEIAQWLLDNNLLKEKTQLNIYGCEFAKGEKGRKAVESLQSILGISVAASDDITGIDGDWDLEVGTASNVLAVQAYPSNLQVCNCTDYIYLNEPVTLSVHKFQINADGSLTEVFGGAAQNQPWYPGDNVSELPSPHGLAADLNGFLYIGEGAGAGNMRKLNCDGEIVPTTEFAIPIPGAYNFGSVGNTIYANTGFNNAISMEGDIQAYDLCTSSLMGEVEFCENPAEFSDWGFYIDPRTDKMYATASGQSDANYLWVFDASDFDSDDATCINAVTLVDPLPAGGAAIWGVVTDVDENIYIAVLDDGSGNSFVIKYDSNYNLVASSPIDSVEGDGGWNRITGLVYSEVSNMIYASAASNTESCLTSFSTDLQTVTEVVPPAGDAQAKAVGLLTECCPNPLTQTIDQTYCEATLGEKLSLNKLFPCDGTICGAEWVADAGNTGMIYDECDQSITITDAVACGTFSKTGSNNICGNFDLTYNVEILTSVPASVSTDQTVCAGNAPAELSVTTTESGIQWQMSTTSCSEGFTDIDGATSATYQPGVMNTTTYYQAIVNVVGACSMGTCSVPSNCITVTVDPNCYDVALTKSVDLAVASLGSPVVFTITVENFGDPVTGATVNDVLPTGLTYVSDNPSTGTYDGTNWIIGNMAAGATETIEITATADAEGVMINEAVVSINETEDPTDNTDMACVSIPIEVCDNEAIEVNIIAATGYTNYQWYKDGVLLSGVTGETYTATEVGTYTYTVDGVGPTGDCEGELCCPVVIESVSCCPPIQCLPITVTKLEE